MRHLLFLMYGHRASLEVMRASLSSCESNVHFKIEIEISWLDEVRMIISTKAKNKSIRRTIHVTIFAL